MGRYDTLLEPSKPPVPNVPVRRQDPQPSESAIPGGAEKEPTHVHANQQTSKDVNLQTSKPASPQTRLHANLQTGKPAIVEKYSTYLTPVCKRGLKRLAFETERKDYEVLIEAVEQYLERQKSAR